VQTFLPYQDFAVLMWKGYEEALARYGIDVCREWKRRGHADTCESKIIEDARAWTPDSHTNGRVRRAAPTRADDRDRSDACVMLHRISFGVWTPGIRSAAGADDALSDRRAGQHGENTGPRSIRVRPRGGDRRR
jgi:hypothetical protein